MVLTRTMKELWLFGGLDTLQKDESPEEKENRRRIEEDEQIVVRGIREWSRRDVGKIILGDEKEDKEKEQEDVNMDSGTSDGD